MERRAGKRLTDSLELSGLHTSLGIGVRQQEEAISVGTPDAGLGLHGERMTTCMPCSRHVLSSVPPGSLSLSLLALSQVRALSLVSGRVSWGAYTRICKTPQESAIVEAGGVEGAARGNATGLTATWVAVVRLTVQLNCWRRLDSERKAS